MDKYISKIDFEVKIIFLEKYNKYLFGVSLLGLILSLTIVNDGHISQIIYNVSIAMMVFTIGFKILFLDKDNKY